MNTIKMKDLKTGYVLLYTSTHFLSRAIRFFTRSTVNHASICIEEWGEMFVAESDKQGFVPNRILSSIKGRQILVLKPMVPYDEKEMGKQITSMLGHHRYDFASLLFFQVIYNVTKWWNGKGKWLGKQGEKASRRLYCSEAIAFIYNRLTGIMPEWWKYNPDMILRDPNFEHFELEGY